ncbi:Succinate--CoA ligase [GDP-forming] subunit beta [archaeon HR06]|nr:Succinate--CoA ligase [GDP-forming] subunit beta [archaeon HR06]
MRLYEFEAKRYFKDYRINVPKGKVVSNLQDLDEAIKDLQFPIVLKAQVLVGGRGKKGGVRIAKNKEEALKAFEDIKGINFDGEETSLILVEEYIDHKEEYYLSITLNRTENNYMLIASKEGGVDVEALKSKVVRKDPLGRFNRNIGEEIGEALGLREKRNFSLLVENLSNLVEGLEAELAEINPLILKEDEFIALDAKVIVDDNSLFRHPELSNIRRLEKIEEESKKYGFSYVKLEGDIAVIGNGAGLVLASLDLVNDFGFKPACFLDLGGGASKDRALAALKLANSLPFTRAIFMNIFGGITNCVEVANALIDLIKEGERLKPLYLRLSGTGAKEALEILKPLGIEVFNRAEEALEKMRREL